MKCPFPAFLSASCTLAFPKDFQNRGLHLDISAGLDYKGISEEAGFKVNDSSRDVFLDGDARKAAQDLVMCK